MNTQATIKGTTEAWESGELGESLDHSKVASPELTAEIDAAIGMQMISIRLPKSVIEDFKVIAKIEGIGYQPLMRTALIRFAECEAKRVMRVYAASVETERRKKEQKDVLVVERKAA
ncbi:MAG: hypothetical protein IPH35_13110 [Rhodoferax sp.]|nr:hypothetical protein [Rhodoferax sp.]